LAGWLMNGFPRPRINIPGMEFAGTVASLGNRVTRFRLGDPVFGSTGFRFGTCAEYVSVAQGRVTRMPTNASFEEAAAIYFGGVTALCFLRRAAIRAGQTVLVYGASGSVGTAAVQLARHFGAHVTAVCSTANLELVRSLGAEAVIDYTKEDFSQTGRTFDIVHDTVGKSGFWRSMRALKRGGVYIQAGPGLATLFGGLWAKSTGAGTVVGTVAKSAPESLDFLRDLVERGRFRPVVDRCYRLEDITEANRYVEAGHKKGNVVIRIAPDGQAD